MTSTEVCGGQYTITPPTRPPLMQGPGGEPQLSSVLGGSQPPTPTNDAPRPGSPTPQLSITITNGSRNTTHRGVPTPTRASPSP
ncbi:hypothetical protein FA15DRAFT_708524 [Coprinopsis marcescibilis]|uniref:Uncharacterized protein n=1 Tax=Coprinopsis marcescibilis TaxID=230819 RepID=A0A5C3KIF2_COPMA|nr:hypothetical protein FA15DRAFT_708524 [Coprinopsis marcescibilis]